MQKFNPIDAAMLYLENPNTPFHVGMVHIYDPSTCPDGPPSYEDIVEAIRDSLPIAHSFRRKFVRVPLNLDTPYWVEDEDFELEFHIRQLALPKPGNREQLRAQIGRLVSRPLDLSRPPWEMTVIEGLDAVEGLPPGCFAVVLKIHHCAIDGKTGVAMIGAMHQDSPEKRPEVMVDVWEPESSPSTSWLMTRAWINNIKNPLRIARIVLSNSRALVTAAFNDIRSDDDDDDFHVPDSILNVPISAHRVVDELTWPLADLKRVRNAVEGATINDVCMAVVAGSLRRYLEAKNALPEESLVTTMTISIRTPDQVAEGGNQIAVTSLPLRTDITDPIERLKAITADTQRKKATKNGVVMSTLLGVVYNLPGALLGLAGRAASIASGSSTRVANTMVTNVPGPQEPIYFLGAKCVRCYGTLPLMDGGTLSHSVGSYNGELIFSFTACRDFLTDPDFYRECISLAIQDLLDAADNKQKKSRPRRKQKP